MCFQMASALQMIPCQAVCLGKPQSFDSMVAGESGEWRVESGVWGVWVWVRGVGVGVGVGVGARSPQ
jgi:hypothetical protein